MRMVWPQSRCVQYDLQTEVAGEPFLSIDVTLRVTLRIPSIAAVGLSQADDNSGRYGSYEHKMKQMAILLYGPYTTRFYNHLK